MAYIYIYMYVCIYGLFFLMEHLALGRLYNVPRLNLNIPKLCLHLRRQK